MSVFPVFQGNSPRNVARDAKYSVRSGRSGPVVALTYRTADDERWYATTEEHPELVKMVNQVKTSLQQPPNGSFYINEYKQVIVPVLGSDHYYYAGIYEKPLRFIFEGSTLSGEPFDLSGNPLSPGDTWVGPHPGIPYKLSAGGRDIVYSFQPRPNVQKDVRLSKVIGAEKAKQVASQILSYKGYAGGRFYVNEFLTIFAPIQEGAEWRYVYMGQLNLSEWFPQPEID